MPGFTFRPFGCAALLAFAAAPVLPAAPTTARTLSDFTGAEEPLRKWNVATSAFESDGFQNITQPEPGAMRFTLRYFPGQWWDTDRDTDSKDRQRAEVKGLGPAQKRGETFEYATTLRTDPTLRGLGKFCHVFQLKGVDGENGPPLVAISILRTEGTAAVRYWPGGKDTFVMVRQFTYKPGEAMDVRIRVTTSSADAVADGAVLVAIDNDEFQGVRDVAVFRPKSTSYRAKWGFYRGFGDELPAGENWVEHRDVSVEKLTVVAAPTPPPKSEPINAPAAPEPAPAAAQSAAPANPASEKPATPDEAPAAAGTNAAPAK